MVNRLALALLRPKASGRRVSPRSQPQPPMITGLTTVGWVHCPVETANWSRWMGQPIPDFESLKAGALASVAY